MLAFTRARTRRYSEDGSLLESWQLHCSAEQWDTPSSPTESTTCYRRLSLSIRRESTILSPGTPPCCRQRAETDQLLTGRVELMTSEGAASAATSSFHLAMSSPGGNGFSVSSANILEKIMAALNPWLSEKVITPDDEELEELVLTSSSEDEGAAGVDLDEQNDPDPLLRTLLAVEIFIKTGLPKNLKILQNGVKQILDFLKSAKEKKIADLKKLLDETRKDITQPFGEDSTSVARRGTTTQRESGRESWADNFFHLQSKFSRATIWSCHIHSV